MLERISDGVYAIDRDWKFTYINRRCEEYFGRPREDFLGRTVWNAFPMIIGTECERLYREAVHTQEAVHFDWFSTFSRHWIEIHAYPSEDGLSVNFRDVTDRKQSEEALQMALVRAEQASRSKSEFLTNMSHELRTPMNAIIGLTTVLQHTELSPKQAEFVDTLNTSAQSLMNLISDILDLSRIDSNRLKLNIASFAPADLLREAVESTEAHARKKGLIFKVDTSDCPNELMGDAARLRQILSNLVNNAVKFTQTGGITVTMACEKRERHSVHIRFTVRDTGIGIAPDAMRSIFDSFTQGDNSSTRKYGGSGLGLAISKQLAELMGGELSATSIPAKGSEFTLRIKFDEPGQQSRPAEQVFSQVNPRTGKRLLLVEDYGPNVMVAAAMLDFLGYECEVANNGREAIEKLNQDRFDLMLLDVQMPELNGFETAHLVRMQEQKQDRPRMPIVAVTAHALEEDRGRCLAAGMDDFIAKPFASALLKEKIERYLPPEPASPSS